jgi:hypothetical protein
MAPVSTAPEGAIVNEPLFDGPASLVVTSISAPNAVLRELAGQCKARGLSFFLKWGSCLSTVTTTGCGFPSDREIATAYTESVG